MISNDFIISSLNITNDDIEDIDIIKSKDILFICLKLKDKHPVCPYCGFDAKIKDYKKQKINIPDIVGLKAIVELKRRRYVCKACEKSFMEANPLGIDNCNISWLTIIKILEELRMPEETYESIARRYHISVSRVIRYLDSFIVVPRLPLNYSIGIDELHSPKLAARKSPYIAILVDNVKRDLLDILPSRNKGDLIRYFSAIPKEERLMVKYVTIDFWEPYRNIVNTWLPNVLVAADPFHLMEILSRAFSTYRVSLMNRYDKHSRAYYLLKKWHYLLESDKYDFDPSTKKKYNKAFDMHLNYYDLRKMILDLDITLYKAYELKCEVQEFIRSATYDNARERFNSLLKDFEDENLPLYRSFTAVLKNWKEEIINSCDRPYNSHKQSNSLAEYYNGRIGEVIDRANGLVNFERTRARLLYMFNKSVNYSLSKDFSSYKTKGKKRGKYHKD